ncbi:pentatricopeptide repeat-containing protein At2g13600 isoform X1 [Camellia sinensis]|uniref:pentatricopeptide repeat-containing protein At2g13600 isoform X1 n=1 Tax=Camellia sinensis TaxID=4442 RepID=UPI0010365EB2|nr:pentatricopeptide repeat-containing protein At2g13600 isoform X1 [Camellia sinensis]XP_028111895.1 pentatricopeptide repeat-containing protein At2g13600 isoform X1 [Camellia sinensis]
MARNGLFKQVVGDLSLLTSSPFAKLLDSCLRSKSARDTRRIHARIIKTQFSSEIFIQNRLIDVYGKCDCLDDARKVFDKMPDRNAFTWNSILTALSKLGFLDESKRVFGSMPEPDQCSWNSMVSGFAQHDRFDESLEFFVQMHKENFELNEYSFGSALRACAGLGDQKMGTQIHASVAKSRYSFDVFMGSALIDMYAKCGSVACARKVFDGMTERNIVSWNSLITCYEQNGPTSEALDVFVRMKACGFEPDEVSLASVVSACASLLAITEGREIHARAVKFEKFRDDLVLSNALVDMYAKCGRLDEARRVFDSMPNRNVVSETSMVSGYAKAASVRTARLMFAKMTERNIVSWNALIAGYTQNRDNEEALGLFCLLKRESVWPTHYTFGNLLNACANLAVLKLGRQAHTHVLKHGFRFQTGSEPDIFVGNSLIDMYMKCGSVEDGSLVFKNMVERDWVSWNAMIVGYAQNGHGAEALVLFKEMLEAGEKPDHVTMIGVLCACSHAGLVEEGRYYFLSMSKDHGLEPQKDHYTCMVDLLGRAGCLDEAKNLIESMPMQPDSVVWASLLSACKVHGNIQLGKFVAENLLDIDPDNSGPYVLLSNMYAELRRWRDVIRVRKLMRQRGVVKQPGCSWIEIQSQVHVFMVKDKRHHQRKDIYLLLKTLTKQMKLAGYVPDTGELESDEEQNNSDLTPSDHLEIPEVAVDKAGGKKQIQSIAQNPVNHYNCKFYAKC